MGDDAPPLSPPFPAPPADPRATTPVAPAWHTAIVLAYLAVFTWLSSSSVPEQGLPPGMSRVLLYAPVLLFQWFLFGLVWWGLRLRGVSLRAILSNRWRGPAGFARRALIAIGFWASAFIVLGHVVDALGLREPAKIKAVASLLLPTEPLEYAVWVLVALTAGLVEEVVFRGYLQRQLTAWTRNHASGIVLSAIVFGAGHLYQGAASAAAIFLIGALFGALAYACRSLVPGVYAHAWADLYPALIGSV